MTARGFFLKNDESIAEWKFINVQYDAIAKRITLLDEDSDTLICSLDAENEILIGAVHSQDDPLKPLNFIRAGKNLEARLLYPRIPDKNGQIIYTAKNPNKLMTA